MDYLGFLFLLEWAWIICRVQGLFPFHRNCQIYWHKVGSSSLIILLISVDYVVTSLLQILVLSFLLETYKLYWSCFKKKEKKPGFDFHWFFCIVFCLLFHWFFVVVLIFIISFLLLTLRLILFLFCFLKLEIETLPGFLRFYLVS